MFLLPSGYMGAFSEMVASQNLDYAYRYNLRYVIKEAYVQRSVQSMPPEIGTTHEVNIVYVWRSRISTSVQRAHFSFTVITTQHPLPGISNDISLFSLMR
jgi:hypothetical protein